MITLVPNDPFCISLVVSFNLANYTMKPMRKRQANRLRRLLRLFFCTICVSVTLTLIIVAFKGHQQAPPPTQQPVPYAYDGLSRLCKQKVNAGRTTIRSPRERYDTIPTGEGSHTVKARFLCVHNQHNRMLFDFVASAHLAGVPVEVVGVGWETFSAVDRHWFLIDYADAEHLSDDDVVVLFDGDMLFTGGDLYPAVQEFVSKSPSSANLTDPLLVRLNEQIAPVVFSSENNCARHQIDRLDECKSHYDGELESLYANWSLDSPSLKKKYISNANGVRNTQRFMNTGFHIGRVWALRRLRSAYNEYMKDHHPVEGLDPKWLIDQGVFAELYLQLCTWELTSGLLDTKDRNGKIGPLGMVGGMIALDYQQKFTGAYHGGNVDLLQLGKMHLPRDVRFSFADHFPGLKKELIAGLQNGSVLYTTSATGVAIMKDSLSFYPVNTSATRVSEDYWGVPLLDGTTPPLWHFCGPEKKEKLPVFSTILPSLIVLDAFPWEEEVSSRLFWSSEPTPMWSVVPSPRVDMPLTIIRSAERDMTSQDLCQFHPKQ